MLRRKKTLCSVATIFFVAAFFSIPRLQAVEPRIKVTVQPKNKAEAKQEKAPATGKQPAISFDANQFDAGEVWEGDIVTHSFIVKNTGTGELNIYNVKPG
jgi:hypothetical protein